MPARTFASEARSKRAASRAVALLLLALSIVLASPASAQEWHEKRDGRYITTAKNTDMFFITDTKARGSLELRLEWWGLLGQPVESYSMRWNVDSFSSERRDLFKTFTPSLPGRDFAQYPALEDSYAKLRSTDVGLRIEFMIRAPKGAIKGPNFFHRCDARFCYANGVRDLDRGDLPMGRIAQWNTEISPKTPSDEVMAQWQLKGCKDYLLCQKNTLNSGTAMTITKVDVWTLKIDTTSARSIVKEWAKLEQENSPEVRQFREQLAALTAPRNGAEEDEIGKLERDVIYYSGKLTEMNPLKATAQNLDWKVRNTGDERAGDPYFEEWQAAVRTVESNLKRAKGGLARARLGEDLSDEQIARLKGLEQEYVREEFAVSQGDDAAVTASDKAGLQSARLKKKAALDRARGSLTNKGRAIDALKEEWGVADPEASYASRAADYVASLQRDLAKIDGKLAALEKQEERERRAEQADDEVERTASNDPEGPAYTVDYKGNQQGVVDRNGKVLIPYREWRIVEYADGRAKVSREVASYKCPAGQRYTWQKGITKTQTGTVDSKGNYIDGPNVSFREYKAKSQLFLTVRPKQRYQFDSESEWRSYQAERRAAKARGDRAKSQCDSEIASWRSSNR